MDRWLFLAAYTCSGLAGLVYEVTWARLLTLYMGHTTAAASTVTAAFMGGLGLGSALGGRLASRLTRRQALYAYALLELTVVLTALAIALALNALTPVLSWAYRDGQSEILFPLIRLLCCVAVLLLPAVALGTTFPIAVRWFAHSPSHPGVAVGRLYSANTAGAAFGSLGAGFLLIPTVGLVGSTLAGIAASGLSIAMVLTLAGHDQGEAQRSPKPPRETSAPNSKRRGAHRDVRSGQSEPELAGLKDQAGYGLAALVLALTGFATFMYEIAWTRVFSMSFGPSTYAFAATLTSFITGLAAGSFVGAAMAQRTRRPAFVLATVLAGTAVVACAASWLAGGPLLHFVVKRLAVPTQGVTGVFLQHVGLALGLTTPIAFGLGVAFPLTMELGGARDLPPARRLGTLYAVNTFAAVAGALTAGFVAIPFVGLQQTLLVATMSLLLGACIVAARRKSSARERLAGLLPVAAAAVWLILSPQWDRELLASGAYIYTRLVPKNVDLETALKAGTLLYYREGATATVSVKRLTGALSLAIDGKVDASTSSDMLTQKTLAHLPLLLHPNPRDVGIVGLGSGVTLASALVHPVASVEVVEISPEVVEASGYFSTANRNALQDPRTRLILGDGRSHLSLSSRRYDVVISEPSNPWMAGVAALFTREFFLAVRSHLATGGIFCQWAHTYDISEGDLRSVVATFGSVFPNGTMWLVGDGDLLLVGSAVPLQRLLDNIAPAWHRPGVAADLRNVSMMEPFSLLSLFVGGPEELRRYSDGAPLQTDDKMALEFSGPFALYGNVPGDNASKVRNALGERQRPETIRRVLADAGAAQWRDRGAMLFRANAFDIAYEAYVTALTLVTTDAEALDGFVRAAVAAHRETNAAALLQSRISAHAKEAGLRTALSKLNAARGLFEDAIEAAVQASSIEPLDPAALEQLASLYADLGDAARLDPVVGVLQRRFPDRPGSWYYAASAKFLRAQFSVALELVNRTIILDSRHADAHNLLGAILANMGAVPAARSAFRTSLRLDPRDSVTYTNLATLELSEGRRSVAANLFAEALSLDPTSQPALEGLQQVTTRNLQVGK